MKQESNIKLREAVHAALVAQLALFGALSQIEQIIGFDGGDTIRATLDEFAIGIDYPEDITGEVVDRAIAWICDGITNADDLDADEGTAAL